ncbi:MAG: molybdopterin-dependent oxidoreductase [Phycisphaerales bacterium]|jgi:nitrate reductase NapA|nr:molybdopterin-dependent oxidoreductase [Phycisphaerales bacterium]
MTFDRRQFMARTAMAAAAAAATKMARGDVSLDVLDSDELTWDKAPCRFCGTGCHVMVGTRHGRVEAIRGDLKADVNKGLLCAKGYHVGGILYGPDRLKTPMLRRNGHLEPVTWDEAMDVIADRIEGDQAGFAIYGSGQWTIPEGYACQKFIKGGLSNNNIDPNARLCMASAVTGFLATYGVDEPAGCYDDLDVCDVLITWGNNPAEMHPVLFSRVMDRRSRGEKVELFDLGTRRTRTTDFADHYLNFTPQTDLAIANCIARELIARNAWDKDFVGRHCAFRKDTEKPSLFGEASSFKEYATSLDPYTFEYVEEISGVPAEQLRLLADRFCDPSKKITSLWCMGVNQHTRGTAMNTLIHGLHLLSGHFGTPGDSPTSLTGQPSACGTAREVGTLAHALPGGRIVKKEAHRAHCEDFWNLPRGRINPKPGTHTIAMWDNFCTPTDEGGSVSTVWVQVTNPGQTLPNLEKLFRGKAGLEDKFLIVSDCYPTATTEMADLVLPSAMWVEKNGIFGNSERRTQQWFRQVLPPGDARDDTWQVIAAARRLYDRGHEGMRDKDGDFIFTIRDQQGQEVPAWEWAHYYDTNVDRYLFEEYRPFARMKHKDLAPYDVYVASRGLRWPVVQQDDGSWRETRFRFSGFDDPYVADGEDIDFYHSKTGDGKAQIWFRPYVPPPESPDTDYPFWLCTGRVLEHWHSGTMTGRIPQLQESMPTAYVELHAADAGSLGVKSGDRVTVSTRRGELTLPAWVDGRGQPPRGSIFVPFFDERLLVNALTLDAHDPISKQPDYKKCAANVRRA